MSNTGFGEDRPYGAIDDDDDFLEEWRSSWEPTPRSQINEIIEPDEDALVAYRICRTCVKDILSAGALYRPVQRIAYIF